MTTKGHGKRGKERMEESVFSATTKATRVSSSNLCLKTTNGIDSALTSQGLSLPPTPGLTSPEAQEILPVFSPG